MSKKKGLSLEEKRQKMMEIFYEKRDFFQLKELERIAPKEKGITSQSVKDVIQGLVDDNMVDTDKIGTSVYFWAFPSKALQSREKKLNELKKEFQASEVKRITNNEMLEKRKNGRINPEVASRLQAEVENKEKEKNQLLKEFEKYKDCDPEVIERLRKELVIAKQMANLWTDNIFTLKSWCKNKFNIEEAVLNQQFELPEDLDYVD